MHKMLGIVICRWQVLCAVNIIVIIVQHTQHNIGHRVTLKK